MPYSLSDWANIAAIVSAMSDVIMTGRETFQLFYSRRLDAPDAMDRARVLSKVFSTYSDDEVESIFERIAGCRKRFTDEGDGDRRTRCLCSVLRDVKAGNGGDIPFDDWQQLYDQMKCDRN